MPIYEVSQNSDMTEGKGQMRPIAYFDDLLFAVEHAKGRGVMGVGDGEVNELIIHNSIDDLNNKGRETKIKIYGYRKDLSGNWGYGFVDNREYIELQKDPEYSEYVRLKKKFEEK